MKMLAAAIAIAPLLLTGAPPAAAQSAAGSTDRDSYTHQAEGQVELWKQKLGDAGDKTKAAGKDVGDATQKHLDQAWHKTQEASKKLETAGGEGWDKAKTAYEKASHDLARTWNKIHSD
jgi:hypothetical protein